MEALLNLDLIPLNTNTGIRDSKSLFLLGGLDLHLHNSFLEEGDMEIKMGSSEVNVVLHVVLMLMEMKTSMDGVLMDSE